VKFKRRRRLIADRRKSKLGLLLRRSFELRKNLEPITACAVGYRTRRDTILLEKLRFLDTAAYSALIKKSKKDSSINLFAASLADIEKAPKKKSKSDPREKLPDYLKPDYKIFLREEADKLALH
jgi:hypothetical protein